MPAIAMTIVTIAAIPSSVMIVRRGVRRTLRRGRLDRAPPGIRRPLTSQASPLLRAARAPTWIASIGDTRSARQTGMAAAASGSTSPSTAPWTNTPVWNADSTTGSGKNWSMTPASHASAARPTGMPSIRPRSAICAPSRSGRRASVRGGTPSAMPIPISRRCASTVRLIRLNAANVAAASIRKAKMSSIS